MMEKGILRVVSVLIVLSTAPAIAEVTVEDTKKYIIDKSKSCGKAHKREEGTEGRYLTSDIKTKISFDDNQMFIEEFDNFKRFTKNGNVRYESNTLNLVTVDLSLLSTENKVAMWGKHRVYLECYKEGEYASTRCFKSKEERTSQDDGPLNKDSKTYDSTSTKPSFYLYFCNEDTATRMAKAFNHLAIKSGAKQELF